MVTAARVALVLPSEGNAALVGISAPAVLSSMVMKVVLVDEARECPSSVGEITASEQADTTKIDTSKNVYNCILLIII